MKKYLFCLYMILCVSCEYTLNDIYYNEPDQNVDPPTANVDLNFASDTVYINSPTYIKFTINAEGHKFHWIKFYIDDIGYGTYESNSGKFEISPSYNNYRDGTYQIKIEAFSDSKTGSIADGVGAEGFLLTYSWVMIIEDEKHISPRLKKIRRDNGKLLLEWDFFKGTNFKSYVILKSLNRNKWDTVVSVTDQYTLNTYDESYVGERVIYRIQTFADGIFYGGEIEYEDSTAQIYLENLGDKSFKLKWKSYFKENVAGYIISAKTKNEYNYSQVATLEGTDTAYIFQNGKFGTLTEFMLTTIPKNAPSYFSDQYYRAYYYSTKCNGTIGEKSFHTGLVTVPYGNSLIYRRNNGIFFYDYNTRKNTDSLMFSNDFDMRSVSANGKYILGYENTNFFLYDASTKIKKLVSFTEITGSLEYLYYMAVANNGIAVLSSSGREYYIYDFVNESLIASRTDFDYMALHLTISPDARYFSNGYNYFFKVVGNSIQQLPDINNLYYYGFNPLNPKEVIEYSPNQSLKFINIEDRSITKSIPISCSVIHNIDFNSGKILGSTTSEFKVYELSSGNNIWNYHTYAQSDYSTYEFQLCKDVIYWYEGYLIYTE